MQKLEGQAHFSFVNTDHETLIYVTMQLYCSNCLVGGWQDFIWNVLSANILYYPNVGVNNTYLLRVDVSLACERKVGDERVFIAMRLN